MEFKSFLSISGGKLILYLFKLENCFSSYFISVYGNSSLIKGLREMDPYFKDVVQQLPEETGEVWWGFVVQEVFPV